MILDLAKAVQISGRRERSWSSSLDLGLGEGLYKFQAGEKDHGAVALMLDLAKAVQISGRRERSWSSSLDLGLGEGCTNFRQERKIMEQ